MLYILHSTFIDLPVDVMRCNALVNAWLSYMGYMYLQSAGDEEMFRFLWYFETLSIAQAGRVAFVGMLFKSQNILYTLHSKGLLHIHSY